MRYVVLAVLSAFLFGSATPVGKLLLETVPPFCLAGLLYLGAALGVLPFCLKAPGGLRLRQMDRKNYSRLLGAIGFGGVCGPVLLLFGLRLAPAASVSMWLNLELAATAVLGTVLFRDHLGRKGWIGVIGTIAACVMLTWHGDRIGLNALLLVGGASLCWGLDNHLTALIDGITPTQSTFWKGIVAGSTNLIVGVGVEGGGMAPWALVAAMGVGVAAYGFSIPLYIHAAQHIGATRSQMIFASAPFFGVALSIVILGEAFSGIQMAAAAVLIVALITLFGDRHTHGHVHEAHSHAHAHDHDDGHHGHDHAATEPAPHHNHWHDHPPMSHRHPHWPDIHHRHGH